MNYGQLKTELVGLGFSDTSELDDFGQIVPDAINRAITEINLTVLPIIDSIEIEQDGTEDEILYYDMKSLTRKNGISRFLDFADTPVKTGTNVYKKFNDYEIENGDTLVLDGNLEGTFKVFYKKIHTPFTLETSDDTEIELPIKAHVLVPLLAAYYIWLEDEKTKAVDYYNQYEKLSQMITYKPPRGTILNGGI